MEAAQEGSRTAAVAAVAASRRAGAAVVPSCGRRYHRPWATQRWPMADRSRPGTVADVRRPVSSSFEEEAGIWVQQATAALKSSPCAGIAWVLPAAHAGSPTRRYVQTRPQLPVVLTLTGLGPPGHTGGTRQPEVTSEPCIPSSASTMRPSESPLAGPGRGRARAHQLYRYRAPPARTAARAKHRGRRSAAGAQHRLCRRRQHHRPCHANRPPRGCRTAHDPNIAGKDRYRALLRGGPLDGRCVCGDRACAARIAR